MRKFLRPSKHILQVALALIVVASSIHPPLVSGLNPEQRRIFDLGIGYFDLPGCGDRDAALYGNWNPLTLTYPEFENLATEAELFSKTFEYIQEYPGSSLESLAVLGVIFETAKAMDVNPLLVLSIAKQESQFGTIGGAALLNNYFGWKDPNGGYRTFDSPEEGVIAFIEFVRNNITDSDSYYRKEGLSTFYEYLSIHQIGFIAYPGEYPDRAPGKDATPPYLIGDPMMPDAVVSWESNYNPGIYYQNSIAFINAVTGMSLSGTPSKPSDVCGPGFVNVDGYAWPIEVDQKKNVKWLFDRLKYCGRINPVTAGDWPNFPENRGKEMPRACHDAQVGNVRIQGTSAAFDLYREGSPNEEMAGTAIYAIVDGTLTNVRNQNGTCQNVSLYGKDNYKYWYGHVTDVGRYENGAFTPMQPGEEIEVVAGQQIAKVDLGYWPGHCNNTSGRTHLHIDRGCVRFGAGGTRVYGTGGSPRCRDPDFVQLLESIYNSVP